MDKELKAKWVAALRSGEYQQAQGVLCNGSAFCCLGVLSKVAAFPEYNGQHFLVPEEDEEGNCTGDAELSDDEELPDFILERIGMRSQDQEHLALMNDGDGNTRSHTFNEIADYIEANL